MISLSEIGGLYQSTPANIKDSHTKAFMYACDRQIKKLLERAEKTKVWCAIESVDERFLDYMAAEIRALFYGNALSPPIKRDIVANNQYWHMKLGTADALNEIICIIFSEGGNAVEEWFEDGGAPFHFRVGLYHADSSPESLRELERIIQRVKNTRSILDNIVFYRMADTTLPCLGAMVQSTTHSLTATADLSETYTMDGLGKSHALAGSTVTQRIDQETKITI
jgi:P2-related tail formation protein